MEHRKWEETSDGLISKDGTSEMTKNSKMQNKQTTPIYKKCNQPSQNSKLEVDKLRNMSALYRVLGKGTEAGRWIADFE